MYVGIYFLEVPIFLTACPIGLVVRFSLRVKSSVNDLDWERPRVRIADGACSFASFRRRYNRLKEHTKLWDKNLVWFWTDSNHRP